MCCVNGKVEYANHPGYYLFCTCPAGEKAQMSAINESIKADAIDDDGYSFTVTDTIDYLGDSETITFSKLGADHVNPGQFWFTAFEGERSKVYPLIVSFDTYTAKGPSAVDVANAFVKRCAEIADSGLPPAFDITEHVNGIYADAPRYGTD